MHARYELLMLSLVRSPYRPASSSVLPTAVPQPNIISFNILSILHVHHNIKLQCLHFQEIVQLNFGPVAVVGKMASPCHWASARSVRIIQDVMTAMSRAMLLVMRRLRRRI